MKLRNKQGKFRQSYLDRYYGLILLVETVALGLVLHRIGQPAELPFSPKAPPMVIKQVFASDVVVEPLTLTETIKAYVMDKFSEDGEKMVKIIGECENGTWDQTRVNTYNRDGSIDYGIMQVNSKNDKLCKGLDYKNSWKDNVDCGYRIYKSQGISAWACSHKVGVKPFYAN